MKSSPFKVRPAGWRSTCDSSRPRTGERRGLGDDGEEVGGALEEPPATGVGPLVAKESARDFRLFDQPQDHLLQAIDRPVFAHVPHAAPAHQVPVGLQRPFEEDQPLVLVEAHDELGALCHFVEDALPDDRVLKRHLQKGVVVHRQGGEDFVVLLDPGDHRRQTQTQGDVEVAELLLDLPADGRVVEEVVEPHGDELTRDAVDAEVAISDVGVPGGAQVLLGERAGLGQPVEVGLTGERVEGEGHGRPRVGEWVK